jgi:dephospho-CoA kinase
MIDEDATPEYEGYEEYEEKTLDPRVWGLTGSIAAGKSSVEEILRDCGAAVIDADAISRALTEREEIVQRLVARLGKDIVDAKGKTLNRAFCRKKMAESPDFKKGFEEVLHPEIARISEHEIKKKLEHTKGLVFYSAALLIEAGRAGDFAHILLITAPDEERMRRLMKRDRMNERESRRLMDTQMPQEEKEKFAAFTIRNDGDLKTLKKRVTSFYDRASKGALD